MLLLAYVLTAVAALMRTFLLLFLSSCSEERYRYFGNGFLGWFLFLLFLPPLLLGCVLAFVYGGIDHLLLVLGFFLIVLPSITGLFTPYFSCPRR